jgi:MFS family permease
MRTLPVLLGAFGFFGLFWGSFAVLLADLSDALILSPGPLGFALFVGAAASILAMALLGWTTDRLGRRPFLLLSGGAFGTGVAALATAGNYASLLAALAILYAASGLYDVGINAAAVDLEREGSHRIMAILHAAFSAGGVAGALSAGSLLSAGVGFRYVYLVVLAPLAVVIYAVAVTRFPTSTEDSGDGEKIERFGLYRNFPLLLVAFVATLGLLSEGEMEHWSGIYLRQTLEVPALLGASGVAVFHAAMAIGRLGAAWTVALFGNRRTLLGRGAAHGGRDGARAGDPGADPRRCRVPRGRSRAFGGGSRGLLGGRRPSLPDVREGRSRSSQPSATAGSCSGRCSSAGSRRFSACEWPSGP